MKRFFAIVAILAGVMAPAAAQDAPQWKEEFSHDFRGKPLPEGLTLFQVKNEQLIQTEPEGLRITIPPEFIHPFGGIGVQTTFGIQGDFEITATIEILRADEPPPGGYGVGAILRLYKAAPSPDFVNLARLVRAGDKQILVWEQSIGALDEKRKIIPGSAPCTEKLLRLRMKREGTKLRFAWAPGIAADGFRETRQIEFGDDDLRHAVLVGVTGRQKSNLDVRFLELRIRSGGIVAEAPVAAKAAANAPANERNYWWLLTAAGVVAFIGGSIALQRFRRRQAAASDAAVAVQCANCKKRLKAPAAMAGKKARCPQCGQLTPIPAAKVEES